MGKDKRGLDALKTFKASKPASAGRPTSAHRPIQTSTDAPAAPSDTALFRAEVGPVQALRVAARAELTRPRPAPVPRPKTAETEATPPARPLRIDPTDPSAIFRAALGDIAPIKDFNRADLSTQSRQARFQDLKQESREAPPAPVEAHILHDPAALFRHMAGEVAPLKDRKLAELNKPLPAPRPIKREEDDRLVLREALETPLSFEDRLDMGDEAAYLRTGLPRRVLTDLRRGRWVVQGELDLHGMTRDEARAELARFIASALQQGRRCLRVIHGKGHGSPGRIPVLKHLSRGWLAQRDDILAFCQARPHDGGDGALLVLLQAGSGSTG